MKILFVSQHFHPETFRWNELIQHAAEIGHDVEVLTCKPNYPKGRFYPGYSFLRPLTERLGSIKIVRAPVIPRGRSKLMLFFNYLSFVIFGTMTGLIFCRKKYDLIFVCQSSPIFMAIPAIPLKYIARCPLVLWVTDLWPESFTSITGIKHPFALWPLGLITKAIYKFCDKILVSCKEFKPNILSKVEVAEIEYFPHWESSVEAGLEDGRSIESFPEGFNILFAGNLGIGQNLDLALTAIEKINGQESAPKINLLLAGDGSHKQKLESAVGENGLSNVHFLGSFQPAQMPMVYSQADALYISLKDDPIFDLTVPSKLQSYLAAGKPIIGCIGMATANIIRSSKSGLCCPPSNPAELAENIIEIATYSQERLDTMGSNALAYFEEHFDRKVVFGRFAQIIAEVTK